MPSHDGMALIGDIVEIFGNYRDRLGTEVLVASVRHPGHVIEAARLGADVATMPAKVLHQLIQHPLTEKGLAAFLKDWEATGQRIID
jgi:transaldolase